jgi:hypothetical protein
MSSTLKATMSDKVIDQEIFSFFAEFDIIKDHGLPDDLFDRGESESFNDSSTTLSLQEPHKETLQVTFEDISNSLITQKQYYQETFDNQRYWDYVKYLKKVMKRGATMRVFRTAMYRYCAIEGPPAIERFLHLKRNACSAATNSSVPRTIKKKKKCRI